MVNRNFNDNYKNFRSRARQFLIDCRLCWYGVQKYSGLRPSSFGKILGLIFWFSYERNFNFQVTIVKWTLVSNSSLVTRLVVVLNGGTIKKKDFYEFQQFCLCLRNFNLSLLKKTYPSRFAIIRISYSPKPPDSFPFQKNRTKDFEKIM